MKTPATAAIVLALVGAAGAPALAQPAPTAAPDSIADPTAATTIRLQLPATEVMSFADQSVFNVAGFSISTRFDERIELEAGADLTFGGGQFGGLFFLRAGVSPSMTTASPGEARWNIRTPILAGISHQERRSLAEYTNEVDVTAGMLHFGFDATRWGQSSSFGFNIRILGGMGYGLIVEDNRFGSVSRTSGPVSEVGVTIGLAIR